MIYVKRVILLCASLVISSTGNAGEIRCAGEKEGTAISANFFAEWESANELLNSTSRYLKYNVPAYREFLKKTKAMDVPSRDSDLKDTNLFLVGHGEEGDEKYTMWVRLPKSGNGRALMGVKLEERKIPTVEMTCKLDQGLSSREKNELCAKVAETAALKQARKEDKNSEIQDAISIDENEQEIDMDQEFTGRYVIQYSVNEECLDGMLVITKFKMKNNKPVCEVEKVKSYGDRDCG